MPRVHCQACGVIRQVAVSFAKPGKRFTNAFVRYVLELRQLMTIKDVACFLNISWDVVKDIEKAYLLKHFGKPRLGNLRQIAIDEISVGRGHRSVTLVMDLQSGAVVFVGEGKGADALDPFWRRLRASQAKIEAVAIDMSPAYISAVTEHLPDAAMVFDRFHIMKLYNEKFSNLRRDLQREATEAMGKNVLKGTRWLLLKNPEHLDKEKGEQTRLQAALELNQPLATAYYLKERLRAFWDCDPKSIAEDWLNDWCQQAEASGIKMLMTMAKTLRGYRSGLLAWFDYPISTGPLEGTNNKIKTMKRQAYGYRDQQYFKLKIYALHQSRYQLIG